MLFDIIGTFDGIEQAYVSDVNAELVTTYKTIRDDVPELIELLDGLQSEYLATDSEGMRAMYYRKRDEYNGMIADAENDPPYRPVLNPSSPTIYTAKGFDDDDTVALSQFVRGLGSEGAYVAVSSSDPASIDPSDRFIDNLYPDGNILRVPARRVINCDGSKRGKVNEILITNYRGCRYEDSSCQCR